MTPGSCSSAASASAEQSTSLRPAVDGDHGNEDTSNRGRDPGGSSARRGAGCLLLLRQHRGESRRPGAWIEHRDRCPGRGRPGFPRADRAELDRADDPQLASLRSHDGPGMGWTRRLRRHHRGGAGLSRDSRVGRRARGLWAQAHARPSSDSWPLRVPKRRSWRRSLHAACGRDAGAYATLRLPPTVSAAALVRHALPGRPRGDRCLFSAVPQRTSGGRVRSINRWNAAGQACAAASHLLPRVCLLRRRDRPREASIHRVRSWRLFSLRVAKHHQPRSPLRFPDVRDRGHGKRSRRARASRADDRRCLWGFPAGSRARTIPSS